MLAKNCTIRDLEKALEMVNQKYDNNVSFNRIESRGKNVLFTLRVKDSKLAGHRRGFGFGNHPAKRLTSACWHVHGDFFDALILKVNQSAIIKSREATLFYAQHNTGQYVANNWEDTNIGSIYNPLYFSDACDCGME